VNRIKLNCQGTRETECTFDGLDQGSFLATDVGTSATVDVDVKVVSGATGVFTDESSTVGFVDCLLDMRSFLVELAADVDISY
jgi:hypothetical protein